MIVNITLKIAFSDKLNISHLLVSEFNCKLLTSVFEKQEAEKIFLNQIYMTISLKPFDNRMGIKLLPTRS